ncbi:DUF1934 domain-containing protein [[Clostridium] fimetarium]|uniref:Uncharacterized beta-barrel protein YwiB, DUF1934 family n=1 Tax=[Clostridium] fimetarium TaxID=99656 RepID=A0A1I0P227_9FIRM|nr:DUF1934 domain-containing protein [[Clostridium] fimetarium]SEW08216.1 Uncharacterized beta-barrel protein YwiB, DUF1934 family [[Clostridium] fimetarium]
MTENVLITIKGLQFDAADENLIEQINIGRLSEINNKIYVKYDEILDGENSLTRNLIKISEDSVEITKRGPVSAHMQFCASEKTTSLYKTPFGSLQLSILARNVDIDKKKEAINILIEYSIEVNDEQISENKIQICIRQQEKAENLI